MTFVIWKSDWKYMQIFKYILEAKTHGKRFRGMVREQNIAGFYANQILVWLGVKDRFQVTQQCQLANAALMSWVDAQPKA